jgi:aspartate ammonia-lyase
MLRQFTERCVVGITANVERCQHYAESTIALATALNPVIGYAKAAELVKESVASGKSIVALAREKKVLSEKELEEILDPKRMTEPGVPKKGS